MELRWNVLNTKSNSGSEIWWTLLRSGRKNVDWTPARVEIKLPFNRIWLGEIIWLNELQNPFRIGISQMLFIWNGSYKPYNCLTYVARVKCFPNLNVVSSRNKFQNQGVLFFWRILHTPLILDQWHGGLQNGTIQGPRCVLIFPPMPSMCDARKKY